MVLVWFWYGFGMVLVWFWYGFGMVLLPTETRRVSRQYIDSACRADIVRLPRLMSRRKFSTGELFGQNPASGFFPYFAEFAELPGFYTDIKNFKGRHCCIQQCRQRHVESHDNT